MPLFFMAVSLTHIDSRFLLSDVTSTVTVDIVPFPPKDSSSFDRRRTALMRMAFKVEMLTKGMSMSMTSVRSEAILA